MSPTIRAVAFCAGLSAFPAPVVADESHYVDASLDIDGELLSWRFLDLDRDGTDELVVAVRTRTGERELRVHDVGSTRIEPTPRLTVPMLADVLAWSVADVRAEAGAELLLLTRAGIWSYSTTLDGYRDNAAALVREELIYDLPNARALPYWAYVFPGGAGGDLVVVPGRDGFGVWGPGEEGSEEYVPRATFPAQFRGPDEDPAVGPPEDGDTVRVEVEESGPFLREDSMAEAELYSDSRRYAAPALVDLDGDGWHDLVIARERELAIHLGGPAGPGAEPSRVERLPDELVANKDRDVTLRLVHLDEDGRLDLFAAAQDDIDGFENVVHRLYFFRQRDGRLIGEKPDQLLRFEAAVLRAEVADVDGDGRRDLSVRKLELPSMVETVTGLEFDYAYLVFLGERRGFARRPALEHVETYDEDSIAGLAANRELALDCDGDGIADLVELDLQGNIAVRRLKRESSFLRGESWKLEPAPWKRFERGGQIFSLAVRDLNGDRIGDIVSGSESRLTVLLSERGRKR